MTTYVVKIPVSGTVVVIVQAASEQEAIDKALARTITRDQVQDLEPHTDAEASVLDEVVA